MLSTSFAPSFILCIIMRIIATNLIKIISKRYFSKHQLVTGSSNCHKIQSVNVGDDYQNLVKKIQI